MGDKSLIEWTQATWNPTTGCTKVSAGCAGCYMFTMVKRLQAMGLPKYKNGADLTIHYKDTKLLRQPILWKKPRMIFVDSMSDLFHEDIPAIFIWRMFEVMKEANWHSYQILTKRHERLLELNHTLSDFYGSHIWQGVTVENQDNIERADFLRKTNAQTKFLSCEPLLSDLELDLSGINWVIVGGESGHKARIMKEEWALNILDQCRKAGVPFFFKQFGSANPIGKCKCCKTNNKGCKKLQGQLYHEFPNSNQKLELKPNEYFKKETSEERKARHIKMDKFLPKGALK